MKRSGEELAVPAWQVGMTLGTVPRLQGLGRALTQV